MMLMLNFRIQEGESILKSAAQTGPRFKPAQPAAVMSNIGRWKGARLR